MRVEEREDGPWMALILMDGDTVVLRKDYWLGEGGNSGDMDADRRALDNIVALRKQLAAANERAEKAEAELQGWDKWSDTVWGAIPSGCLKGSPEAFGDVARKTASIHHGVIAMRDAIEDRATKLKAAQSRNADLAAQVDRLLEAAEGASGHIFGLQTAFGKGKPLVDKDVLATGKAIADAAAKELRAAIDATPPTGVLELIREVEPEIKALFKCNQPVTGKDEWVERLRDMHARIKALLGGE